MLATYKQNPMTAALFAQGDQKSDVKSDGHRA
jgi:hypothetical protein